MEQFLRQISVQKYTEEELIQGCQTFLLKNYEINEGAQIPYLRALFFQVFNWSKQRLLITEHDIKILVQEVTDSFSKLPRNPALENDWIVPIDFNEVSTISTD
jgi:hypothetical protein